MSDADPCRAPARAPLSLLPAFAGLIVAGALQAPHPALAAQSDTARPLNQATPLGDRSAPIIDGDLSDSAWASAKVISDFHQLEPQPHSAPTERTEVRVLYDHDKLYIAVYCHDSEPQRILAGNKERDGRMPAGDFVRIALDPLLTRRDGYDFEINPAGARTDGLLQNNSDLLVNWNTIWEGKSQRVSDGWTAELAIPFRALSYNPASDRWGFDVMRQIKRKGETDRWAETDASVPMNDMSVAGTLQGLSGMTQGKGIDLQMYGTARYSEDWAHDDGTLTGSASATGYYRITPGLTGTLTYNPDFSDTPLDSRRVNTTRFALFDPETREFFLQDAATFEFGGALFNNDSDDNNGRPFFSRNIGLVNGQAVDILGGAKLSGQAGPLRVGLLSTRTDDGTDVTAQTLSVARLSTAVLEESAAGIIVTDGDPLGISHNTVTGADFQYRNTRLGNGQRLLVDSMFEHSSGNAAHTGNAYGVALTLPNEPYGATLRVKDIDASFAPALGFVNRAGIRDYYGEFYRVWRPGSLFSYIDTGVYGSLVTTPDNRTQSSTSAWFFTFDDQVKDELHVQLIQDIDNLAGDFTLPAGLAIPAGHYRWLHWQTRLQSSEARPLSLTWTVDCCDYYDGNNFQNDLELLWRPDETLSLDFHHVVHTLHLPAGRATFHVESLDTALNFTPDMQLRAQLQYDNVSDNFGASVRFRWQVTPYTELFAALGESALLNGPVEDTRYHSSGSAMILRVGHHLQY